MKKGKTYIVVGIIFILAFLAGNFVYPEFLKIPYLPERDFELGLDLQGGIHLLYEADLSAIAEEERIEAMAGLRDVIEKRVDLFGVREPIVQIQGERLIVELAGAIDPAEAIEEIGKTPFLEFKEERSEEETQTILSKYEELKDKTMEEILEVPDWQLALEDPYFKSTPLTGRYLKKAEVGFDQTIYRSLVLLEFDSEGAKIFEELTEKNIGKILAIYIDNIPISQPVVQNKISGGKAQITGNFTAEEARALARNLNAGALSAPITLISHQSVGPTLGRISLDQSLKAGFLGFLVIILFMILFYRLPGVLASLALAIYVVLVLSIFKLIPVTLTLAGIGGFILSIGMAIDANILIFSRMREELRSGKNFSQSLEEGSNRAWPAIRDGNLTTLIVAAILFGFGTSFIKGFATTLSLGILISMFSAIIITKNFLRCFVATSLEKIKLLWV
ncbi:MAG TPA: protein translocase subunit SecD [Candidatus Humimicrobiaceae bacterium]|nr:protein translocase subunit SecD [Candidatus Humimicrobiaceae bacterium]